MKKLGLYIHIPYCNHKCIYCDFYSIINYKNVEEYFSKIIQEIKIRAKEFSKGHKVQSIFFGGGTPSLVEIKYIDEIIKTISKNYKLSEEVEVTLETNPGTVDKKKLKSFLDIGINRLSIGVQSFDENDLKFLTRIHDRKTAIETIENANQIGFDNISLDLIFNLPNQTIEKWNENLKVAQKLPIKHISTYSLILEKGTILNAMVEKGKVKIGEEEHDAELYLHTQNFMEKIGFEQYEVSNFAIKRFQSVHNNLYWHYENYLGFGTAAHSFIDGKRWWNFKSLGYYLKSISDNKIKTANSEVLTAKEKLEEFVMLGLRSDGIDLNKLNTFDLSWFNQNNEIIENYISQKLMVKEKNLLKLTKQGYSLCDEILTKLIF